MLVLKTNSISMQIFQYYLYCFIFSQWPLIYGKIKFNVLKFLKVVGYSSIVLQVRPRAWRVPTCVGDSLTGSYVNIILVIETISGRGLDSIIRVHGVGWEFPLELL